MVNRKRLLARTFLAIRVTVGCVLAAWCWYWSAMVRTWDWGTSLRGILCALFWAIVVAGPIAMAALLVIELLAGAALGGWRQAVRQFEAHWRRYVVSVAAVVILGAVSAEAFGSLQEHIFRARYRHLPPSAPTVFEARWWPFESSYIYYHPAQRKWGGGD